jgi:hypothetical protein
LRVTRVELLTSKDEDDSKPSTYSQNAAKGKGAKAPEPQAVMESEDDLPF